MRTCSQVSRSWTVRARGGQAIAGMVLPRPSGSASQISPEVAAWCVAHPWPRNLRQLQGVIEAACDHARYEGTDRIEPRHLPESARLTLALRRGLDDAEKARRVTQALVVSEGRIGVAATPLNVHRNTVATLVRQYHLEGLVRRG